MVKVERKTVEKYVAGTFSGRFIWAKVRCTESEKMLTFEEIIEGNRENVRCLMNYRTNHHKGDIRTAKTFFDTREAAVQSAIANREGRIAKLTDELNALNDEIALMRAAIS